MKHIFLDHQSVDSLKNNTLEYPSSIALNDSAVKQIFPKYLTRKCISCGQNIGWHVVERPIKNHLAGDIRCNACGTHNGFASNTQWLRLQIISTRLNGGAA